MQPSAHESLLSEPVTCTQLCPHSQPPCDMLTVSVTTSSTYCQMGIEEIAELGIAAIETSLRFLDTATIIKENTGIK